MKKECPVCQKVFLGRSDKLFCAAECKNLYHNSQRKNGIVNSVDQSLHHNRAIFQQLMPGDSSLEILERVVLERLGFQFELLTGLLPTTTGKIARMVYEFSWTEASNNQIVVERVSEVPEAKR